MITAVVSELAAGNLGDDMTEPSVALDGRSDFCVDYMSSTQAAWSRLSLALGLEITALSG
jgi:hypothetical protein